MASMSSIIRHDLPQFLHNPILRREFHARLRKTSSFWLFLAILLVYSLFFSAAWSNLYNFPFDLDPSLFTRSLFYSITSIMMLISSMIVIFMTATSINREYNEGSWDLLRASPIRLASILLGKMLAPLIYTSLLVIAFLPFYSMLTIESAVSPSELVVCILQIFGLLLVAGSIGLYASSREKQATRAITMTLIIFVGFYYFIPLLATVLYAKISSWNPNSVFRWIGVLGFQTQRSVRPGVVFANLPMLAVAVCQWSYKFGIVGTFLWLTVRTIRRKSDRSETYMLRKSKKFFFWGSTIDALPLYKPLSFPDWKNPIWIKERCEVLGRFSFKSYYEIIGFALAGVIPTLWFLVRAQQNTSFYHGLYKSSWLPLLLTPYLILPYAAGAFRSEMDRNTWDLLISSPLSAQQLLFGKAQTGMYLFLRRFWALFGFWAALGLLGSGLLNSGQIKMMLYAVVASHVSCAFYLTLCLLFSLIGRKTLTAYTLSFFSIFALQIAPRLLFALPDEKLAENAAITISPFLLSAGLQDFFQSGKSDLIIPIQMTWMIAATLLLMLLIKNLIPSRTQEGTIFS